MSAIGDLLKRDDERRCLVAVTRLARAAYEAQWTDAFDTLNPKGIDHALAMQIGTAVYAEIERMAAEFSLHGTIRER